MRKRRLKQQEADLDITSFMNLMIILVPVLLMTMVLSHISVLDLKLPDLASSSDSDTEQNEILEVVIEPNRMVVNYPAGAPLRRIPKVEAEETGEMVYDYDMLQTVLKEVKRLLEDQDVDKKDILILSQPDTDYQTIIRTMDTARSYKAVVAASLVEAELFPAISLGDAPPLDPAEQTTGGAQQ